MMLEQSANGFLQIARQVVETVVGAGGETQFVQVRELDGIGLIW
jgi:hypothetical protein